MPDIALPWSNKTNSGRTRIASLERLVNLFPESNFNLTASSQDATAFALISAPGSRPIAFIPDGTHVHQMYSVNDRLFAWSRKGFYEIFPENNHSSLLFERSFGRDISVSDGVIYSDSGFRRNQIWYSDRGEVFLFDLTTNKTNKIDNLPSIDSVAHLSNYAIFSTANSDQFQWSEIADFDNVNALNFATAEGSSDKTIKIVAFEGDLIHFGEKTIEVWRVTGNANNPFRRLSNATHEIGCANGRTIAKLTRDLYFLSDDLRVYRTQAQSYNYVPISQHQGVEHDLHQYGAEKCFAYATTHEGHSFYHLAIPEAQRTWVYDETTQLWHERATGSCIATCENKCDGYGLHLARSAAGHKGKQYIGGEGYVYEYDLNYFQDGDIPITREAVLGGVSIFPDGTIYNRARLEFQDVKNNGSVELSWSDDNGKTWQGGKSKMIGDGNVEFVNLGKAKRRALRWRTKVNDQVVFIRSILTVKKVSNARG